MRAVAGAASAILDDVVDPHRDQSASSGWWLFQSLASGSRENRVDLERGESPTAQAAWAAREHVQRLIADGGESAIRAILELLAAAPDHEAIVTVGAGPLEDLINDHGDELVELVEQTARERPDFAASLRSVAVEDGRLKPATVERLARWLPAS
jgi:hypothetical protein